MKRRADFYDHDKDGNKIDYTVEFTVTPNDNGDYYQPPSGGEVRDIRVYKTELMESGDVTDELDKMIDEAIEKEIERHN